GVVECGNDAADREDGAEETLTEGVTPNRVAECGEVQRVRRGSGGVSRQSSLLAVDHEPALGQADRRTGPTAFDRRIEVVYPHVDRFADAGAVQTQARKVRVEFADARKQTLQHVTLNLPG